MRSSIRTRVAVGAWSVVTASALAAALVTVPVTSANADASTSTESAVAPTPSARPTASGTRPSVVTLVTGDRVVYRRDAQGRQIVSLTPGSPHYGKPVEFVHTGDHAWVVPQLPRSVRRHLDPSVFDVAALADAGRVSLKVTFARGVAPRSLPGLDVRTATARSVGEGRTTATASYDARRPLPASLAASLRGVARISVAKAAPAADPAYELHTLTINATTAAGRRLPGSDVFVMNADNSLLFATFGAIVKGQWKVSVPAGHYLVVVADFRHVVVRQVTVGDTDAITDLSMADASVKPSMTLPRGSGLTALSSELDLVGTDASGHGSFGFSWSGVFPKVSPVTHVAAGTLSSEIARTWSAKGYRPYTFHHHKPVWHPIKRVAAAKQTHRGIPRDLTFRYGSRDFAHVKIRHYATGPKQSAWDSWYGWSPLDESAFVENYPSIRPSVVHGMFLAGRHLQWDSSTTVTASFRSFTELDQVSRYHHGQHATIPFFRGPVTPVADKGGEGGNTGGNCSLCVTRGLLHGNLSMFSSAASTQFGITEDGRYQLFRGHRTLDQGGFFFSPFVGNVKPGQHLRLVATTTPQAKKYQLSRNVTDTWRFQVPPRKRAVVPILRAAYVPPTGLDSVGPSGRVSYPVTFDNLGPVDARVAKAAVKWSVDGRHWHAAHLTRVDDNTFRVSYRNPVATKTHPYLSLKVTAKDVAGRSISESVEHAYLLPHGRTGASHSPSRHPHRFSPGRLCRTSGRQAYSCFVELSAATRAAGKASPDPAGWGAPALRSAYGLGVDSDHPDTVGVIVAYHYPHAEADMNRYRAQYGLPACTRASGCFSQLNQKGQAGHYPQQDYGWGIEASLDLQMISAACPTCHIVLVEANQPQDNALFKAEQAAVDAGATVTNHSFGRIELTGAHADAQHFVHPGVTAVASTGDAGYGPASFPADSPDVVAVGGTVISRSAASPRGWAERVWSGASSGCSAYFDKPVGQTDPACHGRTEADLSAVASGLAIYNTSLPARYRGWMKVAGTSASSPFIAGMIASAGAAGLRPAALYADGAGLFNDVTKGSNGFCRGSYLCTGLPGYDGPTGLGSPVGPETFTPVP